MNILIVEDDPWLSDLYRDTLIDAGHQVAAVAGAQACVDALDEQLPELIILDLLLPGANGVAVLHELRSYPDFAAVPVIVHSAVTMAECGLQPSAWQDYGVVAFVPKVAARPRELVRAVQRVAIA